MRKVEQEHVSATVSRPGKQKVAQQHSGQTSDIPDTTQLSKQLSEMMEKNEGYGRENGFAATSFGCEAVFFLGWFPAAVWW